MKLEVVTDASGLPLGMATAAANVSEQALLVPALADVPVAVPAGTPVIADKGHDSDPLRDDVEAGGVRPGHPAPAEPEEAAAGRRAAAAAVQAAVDGRADQRLAALLPGAGGPLVSLLVPVHRPRLLGVHPHGTTEVLKLSLGNVTFNHGPGTATTYLDGYQTSLPVIVRGNLRLTGSGVPM